MGEEDIIDARFEECGFGQPGSAVIYTGKELITNICEVNEVDISALIEKFRKLLSLASAVRAKPMITPMEIPAAIGVRGGGKRRKTKRRKTKGRKTKRRKTKSRKTKRRKIKYKKDKKLRGGSGAAGEAVSDPCKGFKDDLEIAAGVTLGGEIAYGFLIIIKEQLIDQNISPAPPFWEKSNRILLSNIGGRQDENGSAKKAIVREGSDDLIRFVYNDEDRYGLLGRMFNYTANLFFSESGNHILSWENMIIKYPYDLTLMDIVVWCTWAARVGPMTFCNVINQKLRGTCAEADRGIYENWRNILYNLVKKEWHGRGKHIQELVHYLNSPEMDLEKIRYIVRKLYGGGHYIGVDCKRMYTILVDQEKQGELEEARYLGRRDLRPELLGERRLRNNKLEIGYKNLYLNMCLGESEIELGPGPNLEPADEEERFMREFPFVDYLLSEDRYLWRCDNPDSEGNYWLDSFIGHESFARLEISPGGLGEIIPTLSLDSVYLSQCSFCSFTYNKHYAKHWMRRSNIGRGFIFVLMGTLDENNEIIPTTGSAWQMTHTSLPEQQEILKAPCIYLISGWEDKEEVIKVRGEDKTKSVKYIYMYAIQNVGEWIIKELIEQLDMELSEAEEETLKTMLKNLIYNHNPNPELLNELVKELRKVIITAETLTDPEKKRQVNEYLEGVWKLWKDQKMTIKDQDKFFLLFSKRLNDFAKLEGKDKYDLEKIKMWLEMRDLQGRRKKDKNPASQSRFGGMFQRSKDGIDFTALPEYTMFIDEIKRLRERERE